MITIDPMGALALPCVIFGGLLMLYALGEVARAFRR